MLKSSRVLSLVLLTVVLVACQQVAPANSSVPVTAVPASPTPDISSPLIGTFTTTIKSRDVVGYPELDTGSHKGNAGGMALPGTWT